VTGQTGCGRHRTLLALVCCTRAPLPRKKSLGADSPANFNSPSRQPRKRLTSKRGGSERRTMRRGKIGSRGPARGLGTGDLGDRRNGGEARNKQRQCNKPREANHPRLASERGVKLAHSFQKRRILHASPACKIHWAVAKGSRRQVRVYCFIKPSQGILLHKIKSGYTAS
jgi:hypothetical protein